MLVLHQMGSHGPAYFKRHPREYESSPRSAPATTSAPARGQHHQRLRQHPAVHRPRAGQPDRPAAQNEERIDTGMLYLSDHGESLGEYNLYLHGTPYLLAPDQQKHVGMLACVLAWLPERLRPRQWLPAPAQRRGAPRTTCSTRCSACWKCAPAPDPGTRPVRPCRAPEVLQALKADGGRALSRKRLAGSRRLPDTTRRKDYFLRLAEGKVQPRNPRGRPWIATPNTTQEPRLRAQRPAPAPGA